LIFPNQPVDEPKRKTILKRKRNFFFTSNHLFF